MYIASHQLMLFKRIRKRLVIQIRFCQHELLFQQNMSIKQLLIIVCYNRLSANVVHELDC